MAFAQPERALDLNRRLPARDEMQQAGSDARQRFPSADVGARPDWPRFRQPESGGSERVPPLFNRPVTQMGDPAVERTKVILPCRAGQPWTTEQGVKPDAGNRADQASPGLEHAVNLLQNRLEVGDMLH